ncbi:MAG TPA: glycoside hydrolase family 9 protein, partial [Rhodoglobus sp.]|nr:glycoside hydrolase family 9 protein [Rhodoglobus sp.]
MVLTSSNRTRWLGAVGAAALLAGALIPVSAASAAPLSQVHTFDDGDAAGWAHYANTGTATSSVVEGEFCAEVSGGANPWDIAVQHLGVEFVEGTDYTLAFEARASRAMTVPLQAGGEWPDVFSASLALTIEPKEFSFDITPDFAAANGAINFQLGAQGDPFTFCLDEVSMTSGSELLPTTDFAEGKGEWDVYGATESQVGDALCLTVAPSSNPWDAGMTFNGVPIEQGANYVLSFTASAAPGTNIRVIVGQGGPPYGTVLEQYPALTEQPQTVALPFTATATFPATGDAPGQVAFHLGGKAAAYDFCITSVSLSTSAAPPPPYSPETGPRVRVNQVGYLPDAPKRATLVTEATDPVEFEVRDGDEVVATGTSTVYGTDDMAGLPVHILDFSELTAAGTYTVAADGEESYEFRIGGDLYQQLRYDALNYFYLARSGIEIDGGIVGPEYAREAGHIGVAPNLGDTAVPCLTAEEDGAFWSYGDWTCPEGYALDVTGGWYDAGDHGKYVVNGGIAVNQLLGTYERTLTAPTATPDALADGTLNLPETGNGVPDVLDEARWELEWMLSMQVPAGAPMAGMVHHKIHDVGWTGLPLLPADDAQERRLHRPSTAATLNLAAVAAQGARLFAEIDPDFAGRLLTASRTAWAAAVATPDLYAPAGAGNNGGGPYDDDEVGDEFYWAASELFLTTGEDAFRDFVTGSSWHTADIFTPSGADWGNTAALGRLALATVPSDIPGREAIRQSVVAGADKILAWQQAEGFATTYPGREGGYEWGSNSMVVNNQIVLATAFDLTGDRRYSDGVIEAMDYLLGRNALNQSYITGYGTVYSQNQHSRWFSNQLNAALPNPPAGSLSGGPNSTRSTWDPTISGLYGTGNECAPQRCYVDHIQSWATNEITVNWNSALSWIASFLADQGSGSRDDAGQVVRITQDPADATATEGDEVAFSAAATGDPEPDVRWQSRIGGGAWADVPDADTTTLTLTATAGRDGLQVRAVFSNEFGPAYTGTATLTVVD